jgi:hypothetical protein
MVDAAVELLAEVTLLKVASKEPLTDSLAQFLTAQYVLAVKAAVGKANGKPLDVKRLQAMCGDVTALRRGDQNAEWLCIERERLSLDYRRVELAMKDSHERWAKKFTLVAEALKLYLRDHPKAEAAYHALLVELGEPFDKSPETTEHKEPAPTPPREAGMGTQPDPTESD